MLLHLAYEAAFHGMVDSVKFVTGISKVEKARNKLTETTVKEHIKGPNGIVTYERELDFNECFQNAQSEMVIAYAKFAGLATVTYGGMYRIASNLGIIDPCSPYSLAGIAQASFDGLIGVTPLLGKGAIQVLTSPMKLVFFCGLTGSAIKNFNDTEKLHGTERLANNIIGVGKIGLAILYVMKS